MINVTIDKEKCIGCGLCVIDCSRNAIRLVNKKAEVENSLCNECSHCVAICPENAVNMPQYDCSEILEYNKEEYSIDSKKLLNFIKFRRSIRQYKKKDIDIEDLNCIIEAGRYSPTAGNRQTNRYIILNKRIDEVREITYKTLHDVALDLDFDLGGWSSYRDMWVNMYNNYKKDKSDRLFLHAPTVVIIAGTDSIGNSQINGAIAASNMELEAYALGLGVCYIGFLKKAAELNPEINKILEIKDNEDFIVSFVIGYPDVNYKRTVNRKTANVKFY